MKKKRIALFILTLLVSMSCYTGIVFAEESEDQEDSIAMVTTDLDTGESTTFEIECSLDPEVIDSPSYIPDDTPSEYGIIGADERFQVPDMLRNTFPYSCIGEVYVEFYNGSTGKGTGFLFGPNDVATAGHVLYGKTGIAKKISFKVGLGPVAMHKGSSPAIPGEYMDTRSVSHDWATFQIDANIGNSIGYFGWTTTANVGDTVQITGFPFDKSGMWLAGKQIKAVSEHKLSYDVDTEKGQSGAPVYTGAGRQVVAIHSEDGGFVNYGKKVDTKLANVFNYERTH